MPIFPDRTHRAATVEAKKEGRTKTEDIRLFLGRTEVRFSCCLQVARKCNNVLTLNLSCMCDLIKVDVQGVRVWFDKIRIL
jgi:hypothetical protein